MILSIFGISLITTAIHYYQIKRLDKLFDRLTSLEKENRQIQKFIRYLGQELKLPEEKILHEVKKPKRTDGPKVIKRTEEDEFQKELPPSLTGQKAV